LGQLGNTIIIPAVFVMLMQDTLFPNRLEQQAGVKTAARASFKVAFTHIVHLYRVRQCNIKERN